MDHPWRTAWHRGAVLIVAAALARPCVGWTRSDPYLSTGRAPDSTAKAIAEIRASERRRIPIEVELKGAAQYAWHGPIEVTVIVTNLFEEPLVLNRRMLVNHPRLQGEVFFTIIGPDGEHREIQRLITPMSVHQDDFVVLPRGQSLQRTVDLADLYHLDKKGNYKVTVSYHNELDQPVGDKRAWKGLISSEPIEITID